MFEKVNKKDICYKIEEAIALLAPDIYMAHAKDRLIDGKVKAVGKGAVNFTFFIQKLKKINFMAPGDTWIIGRRSFRK